MPSTDLSTGYFGKIPATGDFIVLNLPRVFTDRWDRWMSMELRDRPDGGDLDPRVWRFAIQAGIFGDLPCAGALRMSEDRVGRRYPFAVVRLGDPPEPSDPWFDAVADAVAKCVDEQWPVPRLIGRIEALASPVTTAALSRIAFWCDDWEVQEFAFADIHDLAANALPALRAAPAQTEEL